MSEAPPAELDDDVRAALLEHEAERRRSLRPNPPELVVDAAYWGMRRLYEACQLLVMRDTPSHVARETLGSDLDLGLGRSPAVHYSVDLGLGYLPGLYRIAERVSPADPLLEVLGSLASAWPLSSVGMSNVEVPAEPEFAGDRYLLAMYVDRVLEAEDVSRVRGRAVTEAVRAALGSFPELCPNIAEHLKAAEVA